MTKGIPDKYSQERFEIQMEEWLEFAWLNRKNPIFHTYQTPRFKLGGNAKNYIGNSWYVGNKQQDRKHLIINTYDLYMSWRKNSKSVGTSTSMKRCFLQYNEAVPEMHAFFDYMIDEQEKLGYVDFDNLFDIVDIKKVITHEEE